MRILIASEFFRPVVGGRESAVGSLGAALARRGHEVTVATLALPGVGDEEVVGAVRVRRVRSTLQRLPWLFADRDRPHIPPIPDPRTVHDLERVAAETRPHVFHAHDWLVHSLLPVARRRPGPVLLSVHDAGLICANKRLMRGPRPCSGPGPAKCLVCASRSYGVGTGPPIALSLRARRRAIERGVDLFLPVSRAVAELSDLAGRGLPFEVVPNFLADEPTPIPGDGDEPDLDLPDRPFVLFVGDATADKGIGVLLAAVGRLEPRPPLVVVGRPLAAALRRPPEGVLVLGPRPPALVRAALRGAAVVVVPSVVRETFGLVALEAMGAGRPVVASRTGGLPEVVVHGETGLLVAPGDEAALAAALARILEDAALQEAMGAAGRRRAREFSEARVVPRLEEIYERLLAAESRTA